MWCVLNGLAHYNGGETAEKLWLGVLDHDIGYHFRRRQPGHVDGLVLLVLSKDVQSKADVLGGLEASAVVRKHGCGFVVAVKLCGSSAAVAEVG